jgi:hypothetical protein
MPFLRWDAKIERVRVFAHNKTGSSHACSSKPTYTAKKNWRKSRRFSRMGLAEASEAPFPHAKTAPRARLPPRQTSDLRPKNGLVVNYWSKHVYAVHMRIHNARWRAQHGAALSSFSFFRASREMHPNGGQGGGSTRPK